MKTELLTLCEYASDNDGRLSIVDTIDVITARKFPWRSYFYVAARVVTDGLTENYSSITMRITSKSDDSKVIFETASPFEQPSKLSKLNVVAGFKGLIFDAPGMYVFTLRLDDTIAGEYPFLVKLDSDEK